MPLSRLQGIVLRALASHRNPESYVADGAVLNRDGPRRSDDIVHDREAAVAAVADVDVKTLAAEGFEVDWLRREPGLHAAIVGRDGDRTRLEWARDSDFRFFAAVPDDIFGFRLHVLDLATNKVLAAAGRREPRDLVDLSHVHDRHMPLGAVIWAAVGKDPGFSPESLIAEIRRNARYRQDDFADLALDLQVDAAVLSRWLKRVLAEAEDFVRSMPPAQTGLAYLADGRPVQPDPEKLDIYRQLAGRRGGHWPSSPDFAGAMIDPTA